MPHGRSDGAILQFATDSSLLAIGRIKPNSKWTPVNKARSYSHDRRKSHKKTQTSMRAWRKAKLSIKSRSVTSPNYSTRFLEPSTIVTVEKHNWWLDKVCLQPVRCCAVLGTCRWPRQLGPWLAGSVCYTCTELWQPKIIVLKPRSVCKADVLRRPETLRKFERLMRGNDTWPFDGFGIESHQMINARSPYVLNLKLLMRRKL